MGGCTLAIIVVAAIATLSPRSPPSRLLMTLRQLIREWMRARDARCNESPSSS